MWSPSLAQGSVPHSLSPDATAMLGKALSQRGLLAPWHTERRTGPLGNGVDKRVRLVSEGGCLDLLGVLARITRGILAWPSCRHIAHSSAGELRGESLS